eukprot:2328953-Pleurochrysis_carterae.AAC.1
MRSRGSTLVHEAARCLDGGAQSLVQKYCSAETMLELLHRFGADLSERDAIGCTVLHYAARTGARGTSCTSFARASGCRNPEAQAAAAETFLALASALLAPLTTARSSDS